MSEPLPTKEDFEAWLQLPLSRLVLRRLPAAKIAKIKDAWADGQYGYPTMEASMLKNAEKIGEINAWKDLQEFDYEALLTEIDDESKYGAEPLDNEFPGG